MFHVIFRNSEFTLKWNLQIKLIMQVSELRQYFESQNVKVPELETTDLFENVKVIIEAFNEEIWKEDLKGLVLKASKISSSIQHSNMN